MVLMDISISCNKINGFSPVTVCSVWIWESAGGVSWMIPQNAGFRSWLLLPLIKSNTTRTVVQYITAHSAAESQRCHGAWGAALYLCSTVEYRMVQGNGYRFFGRVAVTTHPVFHLSGWPSGIHLLTVTISALGRTAWLFVSSMRLTPAGFVPKNLCWRFVPDYSLNPGFSRHMQIKRLSDKYVWRC